MATFPLPSSTPRFIGQVGEDHFFHGMSNNGGIAMSLGAQFQLVSILLAVTYAN